MCLICVRGEREGAVCAGESERARGRESNRGERARAQEGERAKTGELGRDGRGGA